MKKAMTPKITTIKISICPYNDDVFEVILIDGDTNEEITLFGKAKLTDEQFDLVNRLAPACVFTTYTREDL